MEAAGYMIQDIQGNAIFGVGETVVDAWERVTADIKVFHDRFGNEISADEAYETQFKTYGATAALIAQVEAEGGAISWDVVNGVGCTLDEAEAAR